MFQNIRTTCRCIVQPDRSAAELWIGANDVVEGRLVNVSAGGFAVTILPSAEFQEGTTANMRTCDGTHVVRIRHVQQEGGGACLGLQRVRDPEPQRHPPGTKHRRRWYTAHDALSQTHVIGFVTWLIISFVAYEGIGWTGASLVDPTWTPRLPSKGDISQWRTIASFFRGTFPGGNRDRKGTVPAEAFATGDRKGVALKAAIKACQLTDWKNPRRLEALAAALAEIGQLEDAIQWQAVAVNILSAEHASGALVGQAQELLKRYQSRRSFPAQAKPAKT